VEDTEGIKFVVKGYLNGKLLETKDFYADHEQDILSEESNITDFMLDTLRRYKEGEYELD
jgi:hypothetical protein